MEFIFTSGDGYKMIYNSKEYFLLEGESLGVKATSDILFVVDEEYNYICHVMGANSFLHELRSEEKTNFFDTTVNLLKYFLERSLKHDS